MASDGPRASVTNQHVRLIDNPGRRGRTTGKTRSIGPLTMVEVAFGPNDKEYLPVDSLELIPEQEDSSSLFAKASFGTPRDLRRILTWRKVQGNLTNVFYSMESSNTDFYPHQFKPVLSFIESVTGRLLIADEVGLGKTIESMYIWQELRAREDARRLLIVCPAMLREKWKLDLRNHFSIEAEIANGARLLEEVERVAAGETGHPFALIASLEGIRPPRDWDDTLKKSPRAKLARMLLDSPAATARAPFFNLAVIDEAHYLRNPDTANNRFGRLLRDASENLILLTATPIQTESANLYNLLRLVDEDFFVNQESFESLLQANRPIVGAMRALWSTNPNPRQAAEQLEIALRTPEFKNDPSLKRVRDTLKKKDSLTLEEKVDLGRMVETRSLLSHYMSRTRKRDAFENRVTRKPEVREFSYSAPEKEIYETVSHRIRQMSEEADTIGVFRLIARQRQMASCMVAAIKSWDEKGVLEEYLWDDLAVYFDESETSQPEDIREAEAELKVLATTTPTAQLEAIDGKYGKLRELVAEVVDGGQKVVIFAFYRGTLKYLNERLSRDGYRCSLILGGMGDEKYDQIAQFKDPFGTPILLSSEVGSEGIDLQFCNVLVNYDLPWNPMRVEQRIGRIDRLGQKAEKVFIYNFYNKDTIEDRILRRLYKRLNIFRESIGDLEEVLGDVEDELRDILLNPHLTPEEREQQADQTAQAIRNRSAEQSRLEEQAVNLVGFTDYLLDTIHETREQGRWIDTEDLRSLVSDYVTANYPGSVIKSGKEDGVFHISLSAEARDSLSEHIRRARLPVSSAFSRSREPVPVLFDPRLKEQVPRGAEAVTVQHPLIRWIADAYTNAPESFHKTIAALLTWSADLGVEPGNYVFAAQRWEISGIRNRVTLAYQLASLNDGELLSPSVSERLVTRASRNGASLVNARNNIDDLSQAEKLANKCEEALNNRFGALYEDAAAENEALCRQEELAARRFAERRISQHEELIERFRGTGQTNLIPMREGLIRREEELLEEKLKRINKRRSVVHRSADLAKGYIRVERG